MIAAVDSVGQLTGEVVELTEALTFQAAKMKVA
jgi:hypothetical protein